MDLLKTNYCESICQGCFHLSGTKVRGSKTIRYRRSLNHKLCRLGIGRCYFLTRSAPYEKSKCLGSRGSMVARLKLKEIDGRAPPGVNRSRFALPYTASPSRVWWCCTQSLVTSPVATSSNCGKPSKGDTTKQGSRELPCGGGVTTVGMVRTCPPKRPLAAKLPLTRGEGPETRRGWVGLPQPRLR